MITGGPHCLWRLYSNIQLHTMKPTFLTYGNWEVSSRAKENDTKTTVMINTVYEYSTTVYENKVHLMCHLCFKVRLLWCP